MKALVSLALMFPLMCHATTSPSSITTTPSLKTFVCSKYTDNLVDPKIEGEGGFMTDNPAQDAVTEVQLTDTGYNIEPGVIFPHGRKLTNPAVGGIDGFAGDKRTMVFQRESETGNTYFMIYITPEEDVEGKPVKEQVRDNPITRLVTVAACSTE